MNTYETVIVITPALSEDQVKECTEKFRKLLKQYGGQITFETRWGEGTGGVNHLFEYKCMPATITEFASALERDQRILRFTTIRLG